MHSSVASTVQAVPTPPTALAPVADPGVALRRAFSHVPSGVVAICAEADGELIGMAASTFVPVSLDPPLAAFCAQNSSATWARLSALPAMGISVLGADHRDVARALGSKEPDRFAAIEVERADDGAIFIKDSLVTMLVSAHSQTLAGDHTIVVFAIDDLECSHSSNEPMVFHRSGFRRLVPDALSPQITGSWVGASFFPV